MRALLLRLIRARAPRLPGAFLFVAVVLGAAPRAQGPEVIRIGTLPGLRYDVSAFFVRPGAAVELVFTNADEMLHNIVITRPAARERVVQAALALGSTAADRQFVPATPDVLWASRLVQTGQSFTLKFTAPTALGDYPYVCTMPGHGIVMFGTMTVTNTPRPPVKTPLDLPPAAAVAPDHSAHATRGVVTRGFMPEAGPASIAVQLPGGVSYVWDTGAGRFRYAWTGGHVTMPASPERGLARINGQIFYREPVFPLETGAIPTAPRLVEFLGYTLDATGIPEFETRLDGTVSVRERAEVRNGSLIRRFRIAGADTIWFRVPDAAVATTQVSNGTREGSRYRLGGAGAREFTVTMPVPSAAGSPATASAPVTPASPPR